MFFDIVNRLVKSVLLLVSSDCLDFGIYIKFKLFTR